MVLKRSEPNLEKTLKRKVEEGLVFFGLPFSNEAVDKCCKHLFLLKRWSQVFNLSGIKDLNDMVVKHVLDSVSIVPFLKGEKIIDVGSGAGFPGIPIAILLPNISFSLLDSNGKKIRFLTEIKSQLQLNNVTIVNDRVEKHVPVSPYDMVVCRAFSSLEKIVLNCSRLVAPNGSVLAMKAALSQQELTAARVVSPGLKIHKLEIPSLKLPRHLVELQPVLTI